MTLQQLHRIIASHLDQMKEAFEDPLKIKATIILRDPEDEQCEACLTDDNYAGIRAAIDRAEKREDLPL